MATIVNSPTETLSPGHFSEIIADSAVNPDVAEARGYRTLYGTPEDRTELQEIGFTKNIFERKETYPALLIPVWRATGEVIAYQLKPAVPRSLANGDGKTRAIKYENPRGSQNHIDVPPFTQERLQDLKTPLWITEGMKKVDALISQGRAAIGLTGVYNWRRKLGTLGDWEDVPLKGRDVVICFDSDASDNRNVQLAMRRFGAWLESKGVLRVFYLIVPKEFDGTPIKGVDDWFASGGDLKGLQEAASLVAPADEPKDASFTDAVLTETVCEESLEGRFCWASGLGWMSWNGHVWSEVSETVPTEAVRVWVIQQFQATLDQQRGDSHRDMSGLISGWRSVLSKGRIKALVDLARGVLERNASEFDGDPDLLCVKNGYVDLRTGKLYDPDPDKLMTKSCNAEYVPDAVHPMWNKALEALPAEVLPWYQDRIGQAATGYMTPDDLMVISQGDGENGKSTIVNAIQKTLRSGPAGYAAMVSDRILMANPDAHPTEFMDLRGCRYAFLEETPEARHLDVHRLKKVVGTEMITARKIRQDSVAFDATHSLFVNTNFRPIVTETDHGTWRRLALVSFPYTYRKTAEELQDENDRLADPTLRATANKDQAFRRAVLAWIVQGAQAWFRRGQVMLPLPPRVQRDTLSWRGETDLIMGFASEVLKFIKEGRTGAKEMLASFNGWTEVQGHKPWTEKTFAGRFGAHEIIKGHRVEKKRLRPAGEGRDATPVMTWVGVTLGDDGLDLFSGPNGTDPTGAPDPEDVDQGPRTACVQRVQAVPVTRNMEPSHEGKQSSLYTLYTPGQGPKEQNGHTSSGAGEEQNGQEGNAVGDSTETPGEGTLIPVTQSTEIQGLFDEPEPEGQYLGDLMAEAAQRASAGPGQAPSSTGPDASPPAAEGWAEPVDGPHGPVFGLDLETAGKDWARAGDGFVRLAGWGGRTDTRPGPLVDALRAGGTWVGANILGFDLPVLARHHGLGLEETWGRVRDVQLQAMIADPPTSIETTPGPYFKSYSLDAVSERVLGEPKDIRGKALVAEFCTTPRCAHGRSSQCNGWSNIPPSDSRYRAYCVDDQNRAVRIHNALPWTPYMEREMKVQAIMSQITLNGFRVDTDLLHERIKEGQARKADAVLELKERFGMPTERVVRLKTKTRTEIFKSPLATTEGRAWLEAIFSEHGVKNPPKTDKGALATGAEVLKEISTHPKCPAELKKILDLMGIVTSERTIYGTIRDHLVGDRVHPSIWPRQASGRWSITDPGLTVVGKSGKLSHEREVFLSDPGEVIITIDLGQIDARIVAVHAQDENYLAQFAPGEDLHDNIALQIFGSKAFRQDAKALGHGANYGMGESRMIKDGHDPIRVRAFFRGREQMFPGLIEWTNKVRKAGEAGELLDNGFGRMLRVHPRFAYTQAPAQIGQGGTRDMLAECLLDLVKAEPRVLPMLRAVVHDEIVLSVPKEEAEEISRFVVRTFERDWAPPGKSIPVRVIADSGKPGKNWADAYAK